MQLLSQQRYSTKDFIKHAKMKIYAIINSLFKAYNYITCCQKDPKGLLRARSIKIILTIKVIFI